MGTQHAVLVNAACASFDLSSDHMLVARMLVEATPLTGKYVDDACGLIDHLATLAVGMGNTPDHDLAVAATAAAWHLYFANLQCQNATQGHP